MEPIRWCEEGGCPVDVCYPKDLETGMGVKALHVGWGHAECLMVESYDGSGRLLGLLAADKCEACEGGVVTMKVDPPKSWPCGECDGSGYTLRAEVRRGKNQMDIAADSYNEGWSDALDATDKDRVAVLPVERNRP